MPTKIGEACHVLLPAATSGEMNLTSMNGERRMRLTERYMDPPGQAMPDCLIAARHRQPHGDGVPRRRAKNAIADQFKGFDWQTEEDAFMDGYHAHAKGGEFVTYERLRAMGTNGFQEPATAFTDGKIVGTKRLYADGKFGKDGKAKFMATQWRGLQAPGKQEEKDKFAYLINNGRANHVWQIAYLDQKNEFVMDRWPYPYIQMNPDDMAELGVKAGDLVEVYNDDGSTQAMVQPTPTAKREGDLHAVRLPERRAGQRRSSGRQRVHHPELQADLGQHPEDRRRAGGGAPLTFKSLGVQNRGLSAPLTPPHRARRPSGALRRLDRAVSGQSEDHRSSGRPRRLDGYQASVKRSSRAYGEFDRQLIGGVGLPVAAQAVVGLVAGLGP